MSRSAPVLFLAPQLYGGPGGVPAYMRRLWEILAAYGKVRELPVHCLSLVDALEDRALHHRDVLPETFKGCAGKKLAFVLKAIIHVIKHHDSVVLVGHIGQAPIAWTMSKLGLIQSYILVLHGIEAWQKAAWLDRQAARGATCIIATTRYTAQEFCKHNGIPPERIRVIPLSLGEENLELPAGRQRLSHNLAILTVGRLAISERYKGIDTLIRAVEKARSAGVKVHLTVVGDGDDLPQLRKLASLLGVDNFVAFLGAVPDSRLRELYQECDAFAMPSKGEGFGIVFLEAMLYGKPCIGGNHGGTPEVIDHGIDGYLVEHGDVEQLTHHLIDFFQRPTFRQAMGLRGYQKVKAKYLFPQMRNNWFCLLDEVVGRS